MLITKDTRSLLIRRRASSRMLFSQSLHIIVRLVVFSVGGCCSIRHSGDRDSCEYFFISSLLFWNYIVDGCQSKLHLIEITVLFDSTNLQTFSAAVLGVESRAFAPCFMVPPSLPFFFCVPVYPIYLAAAIELFVLFLPFHRFGFFYNMLDYLPRAPFIQKYLAPCSL